MKSVLELESKRFFVFASIFKALAMDTFALCVVIATPPCVLVDSRSLRISPIHFTVITYSVFYVLVSVLLLIPAIENGSHCGRTQVQRQTQRKTFPLPLLPNPDVNRCTLFGDRYEQPARFRPFARVAHFFRRPDKSSFQILVIYLVLQIDHELTVTLDLLRVPLLRLVDLTLPISVNSAESRSQMHKVNIMDTMKLLCER